MEGDSPSLRVDDDANVAAAAHVHELPLRSLSVTEAAAEDSDGSGFESEARREAARARSLTAPDSPRSARQRDSLSMFSHGRDRLLSLSKGSGARPTLFRTTRTSAMSFTADDLAALSRDDGE